jgi:hypothetical protein
MEELIKQVTERAGISEEQARSAVNTVIGYLKTNLPAGLAGPLDSVLGGGAGTGAGGSLADQAGNLVGGLGGMFGGNKD